MNLTVKALKFSRQSGINSELRDLPHRLKPKCILFSGAPFNPFGDEGRGHRSYQRAVIQLEGYLAANCHSLFAAINDEVIAARSQNGYTLWGCQTFWISVHVTQRQNGLLHVSAIGRPHYVTKGVLGDLPPWFGGLGPTLDHLGNQCDGIGVKPLDGLSVQRFAPQKQGFTQAQMVDATCIRTAKNPVEIAGIAAGHCCDNRTEGRIKRVGQARQLAHICGARRHAATTCQIRADALKGDIGEVSCSAHDSFKIGGHYALAQIPQFDHQNDAVRAPLRTGRLGEF